jgi:hypothetical protein
MAGRQGPRQAALEWRAGGSSPAPRGALLMAQPSVVRRSLARQPCFARRSLRHRVAVTVMSAAGITDQRGSRSPTRSAPAPNGS